MKKHFPDSIQHGDIKTTDFRIYRGRIDLITGGDPCQPSSRAGKKKGKTDERYLWPEKRRAIKEIRPKVVVNENVTGTIENGILDEKISDLETLGYSWWPPFIIPACSTGSDHQRERVWLVAYSDSYGMEGREQGFNTEENRQGRESSKADLFNQRKFTRGFADQSESELIRADDGLPDWMERVKGMGNAIVPQVAFEIFKAIEQYKNFTQ